MAANVAVVAVSYNSASDLPGFVASLADAGAGLDGLELIVVDNASTDDSAAIACRLDPDATVVELPVNIGYAGGINAGIARADRASHVFVANTDLELSTAEPDDACVGARWFRGHHGAPDAQQ